MISKTSVLLFGAILSLFVVSSTVNEAEAAFEPTQKELKIIEKLSKVQDRMERVGEDHPSYPILKERESRQIMKLNDLGLFLENQSPSLEHLTEQYQSTRDAARAGIEPVDDFDSGYASDGTVCKTCTPTVKTMYVKAAYKDPLSIGGVTLPVYSHYAGVDSADISTGEISAKFIPKWKGLNQGIIPYCHTSSVTLPATASYTVSIAMWDKYQNGLIPSTSTNANSHFVWYDTNDQFSGPVQNNVQSGPTISCVIKSVSVS